MSLKDIRERVMRYDEFPGYSREGAVEDRAYLLALLDEAVEKFSPLIRALDGEKTQHDEVSVNSILDDARAFLAKVEKEG